MVNTKLIQINGNIAEILTTDSCNNIRIVGDGVINAVTIEDIDGVSLGESISIDGKIIIESLSIDGIERETN
jgi:hypothetical protein